MGLLDGDLAQDIFDGFNGKLLDGVLRRDVVDTGAGLDDFGDPNTTTPTTWNCHGFIDQFSDFFKGQNGIPDTDLKVMIFAKSLPAGVRPRKDDKAFFRNTWYQLRGADTDPAEALWTCRAFQIPAPGS